MTANLVTGDVADFARTVRAHQIVCDDLTSPQHISVWGAQAALLEYWHAPLTTVIGKIGWARVERVFSAHGRVQLRLPEGMPASARLPAKRPVEAGQMVLITITAAAFADKPCQAVMGAELAGGHMVLRLQGAGKVRASLKSPKPASGPDVSHTESAHAFRDRLLAKLPEGVDLVLRRRAGGDHLEAQSDHHLLAECDILSTAAKTYLEALTEAAPAAPKWIAPALDPLTVMQLYHPEATLICQQKSLWEEQAATAAEQASSQAVTTSSGATLWIEATHALVAIDVDSAASQKPVSDLLPEICTEIMRQIRLRQLAGMIMVDLPRMAPKHRQQALGLCRALACDDPRHPEVLGFGPLGVLEMRVRHGRTPMADLRALISD